MTTHQLLNMLANATATYYGAGGHYKATMNNYKKNQYLTELKSRHINIPTDKDLLATGLFNGDGSY